MLGWTKRARVEWNLGAGWKGQINADKGEREREAEREREREREREIK